MRSPRAVALVCSGAPLAGRRADARFSFPPCRQRAAHDRRAARTRDGAPATGDDIGTAKY
jgi:hypothetical protein